MKQLKIAGLLLLIGAGLSRSSFGYEMEDPYIPAMIGMIKDSQQEQAQQKQAQQEQKIVEHVEEIKRIDSKPKEENIKVESRKKMKVKKKKIAKY